MTISLGGPNIFQTLRYVPAFRRHYAEAFLQQSRKYGSVYQIQLPFKSIFVGDPKLIDYVLRKNAKNYIKGKIYEPLKPILGNGLVTSEGDVWKKSRKTIAPEFHTKSINGFIPVMMKYTHELSDKWTQSLEQNKEPLHIDISEMMMALTLSIVGETFFGDPLGSKSAQIADNLYVLLEHSVKKTTNLFNIPDSFPTKRNKRARLAAKNLDQLVSELIQNRKQGLNQNRQDVLSRLLLAKEIDDRQLLDEVKTMILAGHETTSLALTWSWYLLAKNPNAEKKLHEEVDKTQKLEELTYTRQVILEAMRLYPPIPVISRQAIADDEFEGLRIPKGSTIHLAPYVTHRNPLFWEKPEEFMPERFAKERSETDGITYFPFAAGARACIGEAFAMTEAILILASLASKFRFELQNPNEEVQSEAVNTLRPLGGLNVVVIKR